MSLRLSKSVLVLGGDGQLGSSLRKITNSYDLHVTFANREKVDLSDLRQLEDFIETQGFSVIINAAAYTQVDTAETETDLANNINHLAVKELSQIAKRTQTYLLHLSTDYVFDGNASRPYGEGAMVNPKGVYGQTKLEGEIAMQSVNPAGCIIRTSWLYSEFGSNFLLTMLRLMGKGSSVRVVSDQVGTPTYATDLAHIIFKIVRANIVGQSRVFTASKKPPIFHFSNGGVASWYDFAYAIHEYRKFDCELRPIKTEDYPTDAERPNFSVLDTTKIRQTYNLNLPHWRISLKECLKALSE